VGDYMKKRALYFIIAALLLMNVFTIQRLNNLENNIDNRLRQREYDTSSLRNEINNIYSTVDAKLKKQVSIIDSYTVTYGEFNPSNLTVPVTVIITPKEYSKGLAASIELKDKNVAMKSVGTSFTGTADFYIFDEFKLKISLEKDGVKKVETVEEYAGIRNMYLLDIQGGFEGQSSYSTNQYEYNGKIDLYCSPIQNNGLEAISIITDVNGEIVSERKVDPSDHIFIDVKEKVKLVSNGSSGKLTLYALVKDKYGLNYKYVIHGFNINGEGQPVHDDYEMNTRAITEITDSNGRVLYSIKNNTGK
jgi:hypothetical protein